MIAKKTVSSARAKTAARKPPQEKEAFSASSHIWLELRAEGYSVSEAAKELKLSVAPLETIEDLRHIELMRLEKMFAGIAAAAFEGEAQAIDRALAILARRAKLLGFDAARGSDGEGAQAAETLSAKIEAIAARLAAD